MSRHLIPTGIIFCLTLALATSGHTAPQSKFESLCAEILESLQSFYPVRATEMGIHAFDHRFTDYSSNSVKAMIKELTEFEKQLYKYKGAQLSDYERLNYELIKSNVDIALHDLKRIAWHKKLPQIYVDEVINGVYYLLLSNHAPLSERVVLITARMKAAPAFLETARTKLKKPPPIYVEAATVSLESGIQFYKEVAAELMNKFPERADDILRVSTAAREAMNEFLIWLTSVETGEETDFAIGKDNFDYKLRHEYFLPFDTDSLLALGELWLAEAQQAYAEYEEYMEYNHQAGQDSVFVPASFTRDDILEYYSWETEQVRIFLNENDIISIPGDIAPVTVVETPPFLRSRIGGIAYHPAPPFDSVQQAYFYVRPVPKDMERKQLEAQYRYVHRRGFKGSVVHEAYPGHHLQLQLAAQHPDPVRKWQMNLMMIEGWALYCEEMMYEQGLYGEEDPSMWLAILGGIRFRAARIVADVKLHTGQLTYEECVDWMIENLDIATESGKEYIRTEVRRYTYMPTYQMSYLVGKREIMSLLEAVREREGDAFSLREFHDRLLAQGSVPPALMWEQFGIEAGSGQP